MELDPVSAIIFSSIQGIVGQFDKGINGRGMLLRKADNSQAYGKAEFGKRSAEFVTLHRHTDPVCHENRFFQ